MEDVAIAYGFNAIMEQVVVDNKGSKRLAASLTLLPLNELSDLIRKEVAMAGFTEVLTFILCSKKENFSMLNRKDDKSAIIIGNPRSLDFEAVRTTLMSGILKTVAHNKDHPKPKKIFEVCDIAIFADNDVGAKNLRKLVALYCGANAGFEIIHGLVDRVMEKNGVTFVSPGDNDKSGYYIERSDELEFLAGRQARIIYKGTQIGNFGIVHPEVLNNFDIPDPCSFVELNIFYFLFF
ncbi:phenylalanine--tRNA ligase [Trifolium repens]|nr:phenylalanine--tRNA ligase [Trifolium repens]